jgi:glycosyltransferase involved in cell wall biosynthesis
MTPKISVIIPFRDSLQHLPTLVNALKCQTLAQGAFEVIWIDDASRDGGGLWLQERLSPGWRLVAHPESRGSYAARNTGLRAAASENLAFTDVDCRPNDDWLEQGFVALASASRVAGRIHLELSPSPSTAELVDAGRFLRQHQYVQEGFAATANLFVHRNVFGLVGEFDEHLRSGGDFEFGWRCSQAGISIRYAENAVVSHPARASLRQLLRKGERVGFGVGQVVRRGGMPMRLLARRASERLTLARRRGFKERSIRIVGLKRSFLVTVVLVLVMLATILGCLRGFVLPEAAASADRNGRLKKGIA